MSLELIYARRSIRRFTNDPISEKQELEETEVDHFQSEGDGVTGGWARLGCRDDQGLE